MQSSSFEEAIELIITSDGRYSFEAYVFVREALDHTVRSLKKPPMGPDKHISAKELLEGIRQYALGDLGPVAKTVLNTWGLNSTDDFGEIVFQLVENGVLSKQDSDTQDDFKDGYDFHTAFVVPFLPRSHPDAPASSSK
jgi:uncharacterized repeat protein (TIGR04138 family)